MDSNDDISLLMSSTLDYWCRQIDRVVRPRERVNKNQIINDDFIFKLLSNAYINSCCYRSDSCFYSYYMKHTSLYVSVHHHKLCTLE